MVLENTGSRSIESLVRFDYPSCLRRDLPELRAGTYTIITHEDVYLGAFDPVYVTTSVEVIVKEEGITSSYLVQPLDLAAALAINADRSTLHDGSANSPSSRRG